MPDQVVVRETISITSQNATEADKALGAEFNRVAWEALGWAEIYLRNGPEAGRQMVVRSFLSTLARLSAVDSQSAVEEHRIAFMATLAKMTEVEGHLPDVDVKALTGRVDDQDDPVGVSEAGSGLHRS